MSLTAKSALAALVTVMITASPLTLASPASTKTKTFEAKSIHTIVLMADVGTVRVEPSPADVIEVRVTLRPKRNTGFSTLPDVNIINMTATVSGGRLTLDVKEKNVEESWVLRLPRKMLSALELRVGIGEVSVTNHAQQLQLDLGVGDATVLAPIGAVNVSVGTGNVLVKTSLNNAGAVDGAAGVGHVSLKGLNVSMKSHMIGGKVSGKGRGHHPIQVKVGVGDAKIEITP